MKKTLMVASMLAGAVGVHAQGSLNWQDGQTGYDISIISPNPGSPTVEETGNTQFDLPAGSASYNGGWIGNTSGSPGAGIAATPTDGYESINYTLNNNFTAGLYIASSLTTLTSDILNGTPVATTTLLNGGNAGLYNTAAPTYVSGFTPGTTVYVGIAAWYSGGGATSFSTAVADQAVEGYVESTSPIALGGGSSAPASVVGSGLTSFSLANLSATPEPSTVALGVIGASAFLMRLRRKQ